MTKQIYLYVLILVITGFGNLSLFSSLKGDPMFVVKFLYLLYGWFHFKNSSVKLGSKELKFFRIIIFGMLLSFIPAMLYHGQSFLQSFVTYRNQWLWFVIPVLLKISPTREQIVKMAIFSATWTLVIGLLRQNMPSLFNFSEDQLLKIKMLTSTSTNTGLNPMMIQMVTIPIFYYCDKIREFVDKKDLFVIFFCFVIIVVVQNRSTLFPTTLLMGYSLLSLKSKYKWFIMMFLVLIISFIVIQTMETWLSVFEETSSQLNNEDYERNKELIYYTSDASHPSWLTYILGNGFISFHASTLTSLQQDNRIFASDLGIIGFWNEYGIIPVMVFLYMYVSPLIQWKKTTWMIKMCALFLIAISMTIGYFGETFHMFFFSVYYYLYQRFRFKEVCYKEETQLCYQ